MSDQRKNQVAESAFWTNRRLLVIASLSCWDVVLSLTDRNSRTAAQIAQVTGRTPGALHAPLQRLTKAGIIHSTVRSHPTKGRPPRTYELDPGAFEKPCGSGSDYEHSVHRATSSGLRLILRNSEELALENARRSGQDEDPLRSERWVQFGNLNEEDLNEVSGHFDAILKLLSTRRSGGGGKRYRVALMMLPDDLEDSPEAD